MPLLEITQIRGPSVRQIRGAIAFEHQQRLPVGREETGPQ